MNIQSDPPALPHADRSAEASSKTGRSASEPPQNGLTGPWERDSYASTALFDLTDRALRAGMARMTMGLSPRGMMAAWLDWTTGLALSPGKRAQLVDKAFRKTMRFLGHCGMQMMGQGGGEPCIEPLPQDRRFRGEAWQKPPYNALYQGFLLTQQWWHNATTGIDGVTAPDERIIEFAARQWLDMVSPSNFVFTNPEVLERIRETGGRNLIDGWRNFAEDWTRAVSGQKAVGTGRFEVGRDVAVTPGKVVYRNRLIELIQYAPATGKVKAEPILIVPAWIMKYYILDLSPENSFVKYLVDQGHTVFMISWKNPVAEDRDLSMEDYRSLGIMAALDAIGAIVPDRKVHGVGYCLGGTLLSIAASAMARDDDDRFATLTFLAAQADFEEAGELTLFITEKQVSFLEDMMWEQGFLDTKQMAGAFQLLRSNDLIWSRVVHDYLMGDRDPINDLMAWNADATRMPYRMHSEYLRSLFLRNDLAEGRFRVGGRPVVVSDIEVPIFVVGTEKDHVAPWRSVFKFHWLAHTPTTFLLTSGGHNAGIVSEVGHRHRHYRVATTEPNNHYVDPDRWVDQTPVQEGSWWPEFERWLSERSGAEVDPPTMGMAKGDYKAIANAPGSYVLKR